jgi:predicted AlkP superfamily phosphohydrolase/phosphomutase
VTAARRRTIVIGVDGAEPSIFFSLLDAGRLPFFARMARARGTTRSVQPIISPAAWATVMTGCRPGRHRLFGFQREDSSGQVRVATGRELGAGTLWRYLGDRGHRCIAVNVPMTYPPETTPGVIVSGVDTPSLQSDFMQPSSLKADFLRAVPDYEIDLRNFGGPSDAANRRKLFESALRVSDARARAFRWLLDTQAWDLALVVFTEMDRLQHDLWVDHDRRHPLHRDEDGPDLEQALAEAYVQLDRLAESIVSPWLADDPLVVVMSDHGAGTQTRKFSPAPVLREAGLLHLQEGAGVRRRVVESTIRFLRKQPRWLKELARSAASDGMQRRGYSALMNGGIDFARTVAYPAEFPAGIRLRRDLTGSDRAAAIAAVRECLMRVHDPVLNGPAIGRIWERDELWPGAYRDEAPDLFFEMADPDVYVTMGFVNLMSGDALRPIESTDQSGGHRSEGIFLACGPGVQLQRDASIALEEFFPALSAYVCGRYPENLDGGLRRDIFDVDATAEPWQAADGQQADELGDSDEAQVRARLEGLGYL